MEGDDFTMYKGTTQPVNFAVYYAPVPPATQGDPADLSLVTDALWTSVSVITQQAVISKRISTGDILLSNNTLLFNIVPANDSVLIAGQYQHEMRLMFGVSEYVVYPTPPGAVATFTVYKSWTRGAEGHSASTFMIDQSISWTTSTTPPAPRSELVRLGGTLDKSPDEVTKRPSIDTTRRVSSV